ncbi:MAG: winged helix-turn-helix domain-containing protein [Burkholderiales bacterium]|nr:winged helix-turn-helix domain-containing protein [Phycisphaerae bacterium]
MRRTGSQAEWEKLRLIAANMFEQQLATGVIVATLKVDDQTVRRWRRAFKARGRPGLLSRKHAGRPSRMSPGQKRQLSELLLKKPIECGFDKYLWTQQLIADLIQCEFGISYHHDHVGLILKEMGFTHQKPMRRAKERDEARIDAWRREVWPGLLKKTPAAE